MALVFQSLPKAAERKKNISISLSLLNSVRQSGIPLHVGYGILGLRHGERMHADAWRPISYRSQGRDSVPIFRYVVRFVPINGRFVRVWRILESQRV